MLEAPLPERCEKKDVDTLAYVHMLICMTNQAAVFQTLADPTRLRILDALRER